MNIRKVLAVAAIPFVIGTFGFVAPSQANAANPSNRIAQIAQQPHRPQDGPQRPNVKAQVKHRQPRPQLKKRPPQPPQHHNKGAEQNWGRPNNR